MEDSEPERKLCRRRAVPAAAFLLALGLAGCPSPNAASDDSLAGNHVKLVVIDAQGNATPELIKVKKKVEIVVWVAPAGMKLELSFPENPFPEPVICPGKNFCATLLPPEGEEKVYNYTATLSTATSSNTIDPRLEVVR